MKKLSHEELIDRQKLRIKNPKIPFCIVLNNIRSLHNVGSIFRTSDAAGIEKIWLCGITGCPPHPQLSKTALGSEDSVSWEYRKNATDLIKELKAQNYQIVLLEQVDTAVDYSQFKPDFPVCLVLGNEVEGVEEDFIALCDQALEIEMSGVKNSLNVAVAFGIVAYHFRNRFSGQ